MGRRRNRTDLLICFLLVAATVAVYWQVHGFSFVLMDDQVYVMSNQHVLGGITAKSVAWAFRTNFQANWHPLTWISLMLDANIGGGKPGAFHVTNVVLHVLNTLLLFAFLRRSTRQTWPSAVVAALFALHPLHVESVAWVTERKDVLSTFFWLLALLAYVEYARRPRLRTYMLVVAAFALGLMAKPMLVSLPIVLLLMDAWPLGRVVQSPKSKVESRDPGLRGVVESGKWKAESREQDGAPRSLLFPTPYSLLPLLVEKLPLFAMAAGSCVVTVWAQGSGGAIVSAHAISLGERVANALVAYVGYIVKMIYPLNLAAPYPHPYSSLPAWQVIGSGVLLAAVTAGAVASARKAPYVTVGWLWYVITLIPVIGVVQVGQQAMADRYTYVPLIGLFVVIAWGVPEAVNALMAGRDKARLSRMWAVLAGVLIVGLMANTYQQVGYWKDSLSLYQRALVIR